MTSVLHSGSLSSLDGGMGDNLLHASSISLDSQSSLGPNDEDVTLTFKQNGPFSPTKPLDELSFLAISAQITEVTYSISDVQTRIFEIQELRHKSEANQSSGNAPSSASSQGHATDTSTTNIDQALINLDERLESISSSIESINSVMAPLIASAKTPTTSKTVTETNYAEDATGTLLRKHATMLQDWDTVQEDADTLKGELREDKWLAVFRTVGEQAEAMMVSLEKAVTHCQEFIWQVHRNRKALTDDGHSGLSSGSMSGEKPINYEMFQSLQSSYEAKKRYYMPATTKVLAILDRSVRDRVTKNGECLRRHAEARARWKNLRERINRIDNEMETVRLFLVTKDKEQEPEPSEAGSALSRQTSRSNYTSKSNYLSTPSTKVSNLTNRSRTGSSSAGTASAFSRSMSPLKRFASKVSASVRSGVSTPAVDDSSRNASSISVHSSQVSRPDFSPSLSGVSGNESGPPRPPPRSPFRPPGNKITAISSGGVDGAGTTKEKKKRDSSIFPFLSKPPPPSALGRSTNRAPSRASLSGGDTSASSSSKPRWNASTKVDNDAPLPPLPPSQNATIRATPSRPSIVNQVFRPLSPEGRRSLSRTENRPPTSQGKYTPRSSVDIHSPTTPSRPGSRAQSRAGARTPNGGVYGTSPRTRPVTPSHIPAPVSYFNKRSPSRAGSESDMDDEELPTTLMQRAFTPSATRDLKTPENPHRRRPSNSMIPVPKLNVTSGSRPGTSMSMNRSGSPANSHEGGRMSPRESPSAWRNSPAVRDTTSTPYKESPPTRAGARSQTPESMLRARAMQMPGYVESPSPNSGPSGASATPGTKPRPSAPSSFKGEGRTLVFGPGNGNPSSGANGTPGRPQSRSASRLNSYGFGRMTPTLDAPGQVYVPVRTDELDVEVANVINGMAHGFTFERVDPPRKTPAKAGEEIKAQYAVSNALGRKLITCRLVTVTRGGAQSKKVMCRVGGGWLELQMYILNRQAGLS